MQQIAEKHKSSLWYCKYPLILSSQKDHFNISKVNCSQLVIRTNRFLDSLRSLEIILVIGTPITFC